MDRYPKFDSSRNELPSERRANKHITDNGRSVLGKAPQYPAYEKQAFLSDESKRIERMINNSDVNKPQIRRVIEDKILEALISNQISEPEAEALLYHLEETAEYQSDIVPRPKDVREVQFKDY